LLAPPSFLQAGLATDSAKRLKQMYPQRPSGDGANERCCGDAPSV
jgi:hypothetical protein